MRIILLSILLLCSILGDAQLKTIKLPSEVDEATVYRQGAHVTRNAEYNLPKGDLLLVFDELQPYMDVNSFQFSSTGKVTVLSINYKNYTDTLETPPAMPNVMALQKEIEGLNIEKVRKQKLLAVYQKEETFLQQNLILRTEEESVNLDNLIRAADYARSRYLEIRSMESEIEDEITRIDERISEINVEKSFTYQVKTKNYVRVNVRVRSELAQKADLQLNYFVQGAGWTPSYEARVQSTDDPLELRSFAKIFQSTGEDWNKVKLTVTTGNPQLNQTLPSLTPTMISGYVQQTAPTYSPTNRNFNSSLRSMRYNPSITQLSGLLTNDLGEPLIGATVTFPGHNTGASSNLDGRFDVAVPSGAQQVRFSYLGFEDQVFQISTNYMNVIMPTSVLSIESVVINSDKRAVQQLSSVEVITHDMIRPHGGRDVAVQAPKPKITYQPVKISYTPTQIRFEVDGEYNVPADGNQYAVSIQNVELDADYRYEAVPKVDPSAYLTARISGWEQWNLHSGPMNVYFEDTYVGQSQLDLKYVEDTLSLSLGRDHGIHLEHKLLQTKSDKRLMAMKRKVSKEYSIVVENRKRDNITIVIMDQIPITYQDDIEITAEELSGGALQEDNGFITWELNLATSKSKELKLKYQVKFPAGMQLNAGL